MMMLDKCVYNVGRRIYNTTPIGPLLRRLSDGIGATVYYRHCWVVVCRVDDISAAVDRDPRGRTAPTPTVAVLLVACR